MKKKLACEDKMKTREKDFGDIQSLVGDEAIFYDFGREKILTPRNSPKYFLWIQSKMESAGEDILAVLNCIGEKNDEIRVCFIHSQYIQSTSKYQLTPPTLRTLRLCTSLLLYLLRQHGLFLFMASQK